jgi:hypothetical protein
MGKMEDSDASFDGSVETVWLVEIRMENLELF